MSMNLIPFAETTAEDRVSKPKIAQMASAAVKGALDKNVDPVEIFVAGKAMTEFGEMICAEVKDMAIAGLTEQDGYKQSVYGAVASLMKYEDVYDYSGDTLWVDETAKLQKLQAELGEKVETFEATVAALRQELKDTAQRVQLRESQMREASIIHPLPILQEGKQPTMRVNLAKK